MRASYAITGGVLAAALLGAAPAAAQSGSAQPSGSGALLASGSRIRLEPVLLTTPGTPPPAAASKKDGLVWDNGPSIRYGDWFQLDVRALLEGNVTMTEPDPAGEGTVFEWSRRRIGVQGTVTKYVEYEVDYGFDEANEERAQWRDVFVNVRPASYAQVQGGKFKIPFGYERLTGPRNLDFVYRSLVSDALTPGRSIGVMAFSIA